ncbi:hypothetical protein BCR44DRAFT_1443436, partial [Catenaria anguillulae PL171]
MYVTAHHLFTSLRHRLSSLAVANKSADTVKPPSMFYFAESHNKPLTLNIAFRTLGEKPLYIDFTDGTPASAAIDFARRQDVRVAHAHVSAGGCDQDVEPGRQSRFAARDQRAHAQAQDHVVDLECAFAAAHAVVPRGDQVAHRENLFAHERASTRGPSATASTSATSTKRSSSPLRVPG